MFGRTFTLAAVIFPIVVSVAAGQRTVTFPPAESKPPPAVKAPPTTQAGGEDTGVIPDPGPSQRKTQNRAPPPPTNLTVMYKVEYGTTVLWALTTPPSYCFVK